MRFASLIKYFLFVFVVTASPFLALDAFLLMGHLDARRNSLTCDSKMTNYDYCPSVVHMNYMELADRWLPVVNYIGPDRRSAYSASSPSITKEGVIYLIGDSLIQAKEVRIQERFEHLLRQKGYEVRAFGYSSWNNAQYLSIMKNLQLREEDYVFVFTTGNDYTPSYSRATINTSIGEMKDTTTPPGAVFNTYQKIMHLSLIVNTYRRAKSMLSYFFQNEMDSHSKNLELKVSHDQFNWTDCESIPNRDTVPSNMVYEKILLSKSSNCWDRDIAKSVDHNIQLLKKMQEITSVTSTTFQIFLAPSGRAIKNENTVGRAHSQVAVPDKLIVSQLGLFEALKDSKLPISDLEPIFKKHKNPKKSNEFYFPADGHWTRAGHLVVGKYVMNYLPN